MRYAWLIPQGILLFAFIVAFILRAQFPRLPIVSFQADIGTFTAILGGFLAIVASLVLFFRERIERVRMEERDRAVQERRSFLRRLDHELKNPITAIFMGIANLRTSSDAKEKHIYVESIDTHARRLKRLTADLRKLVDLERQEIEQSEVDLTSLLQETFAFVQDVHEATSRSYSQKLPDIPWPLPKIRGDYDLLQVAFHNVLDNAVKFSRDGDSIELRASEDGNYVVVEIADTGVGIPQTEFPYIWQELYRGEGARGIPGSGLGLALTRAIIHRHNGSITLRSRVKEGTIVTVRLPAI
jgi:two-component system OmpR family sensor kinase